MTQIRIPTIDAVTDLITSGDLPGSLQKRTVEIADAAIKALPSTPVELVPAPGLGLVILPVKCFFVLDTTEAAYVADADSSWSLTWGGVTPVGAPSKVEALLEATEGIYVGVLPCEVFKTGAAPFDVVGDDALLAAADGNNKALELADVVGGVTDYTGGDAANKLTVTVLYFVLEV